MHLCSFLRCREPAADAAASDDWSDDDDDDDDDDEQEGQSSTDKKKDKVGCGQCCNEPKRRRILCFSSSFMLGVGMFFWVHSCLRLCLRISCLCQVTLVDIDLGESAFGNARKVRFDAFCICVHVCVCVCEWL